MGQLQERYKAYREPQKFMAAGVYPYFRAITSKQGTEVEMEGHKVVSGADRLDEIPDVKGLGLTDAIWSIENCGYRCIYTGSGHVVRQSPEAGARKAKGETVRLTLE